MYWTYFSIGCHQKVHRRSWLGYLRLLLTRRGHRQCFVAQKAGQIGSFGPIPLVGCPQLLPLTGPYCPNQNLNETSGFVQYWLHQTGCLVLALPGMCLCCSVGHFRRDLHSSMLVHRRVRLTASGGRAQRQLHRRATTATGVAATNEITMTYLI